MPSTDSSINRWLRRLGDGDDLAAEKLWNAYYEKLVRVAAGRLQARHRKTVDAEDVALHAFDSFCRGVKENRYPQLTNRDGVWRLLVSITIHKVLHVVRSQGRLKRGGEMAELEGLNFESDYLSVVNQLISREPSPEFACQVAEQMDAMMAALNSRTLEKVAHGKLQGFTNDEIAERLGCSLRTIERKLNLIRKIWVLKGLADC